MKNIFFFAFVLILAACGGTQKMLRPPAYITCVTADVETPAVRAAADADAADDPAVWVHPQDPARSVIVGTVKRYGLEVYNLQGQVLHSIQIGNPNNVDIQYGFTLSNGQVIDLVVCSDRSTNEILVFQISPSDQSLRLLNGGRIKSALGEVYGICLYKSLKTKQFYVFLNGKDGSVEQYELLPSGMDGVRGELRRKIKLKTQPEGMVADHQAGIVYFGEEDRGIWRVAADPGQPATPTLIPNTGAANPHLAYDIEGLAIFPLSDTTGYLLASSQGNNTYAVFDRQDNRYLGSFCIGDGAIDGTFDTDGIEACARPLGPAFPKGLFVAQDGANTDAAGQPLPQNFKLVAWEKIAAVIATFK